MGIYDKAAKEKFIKEGLMEQEIINIEVYIDFGVMKILQENESILNEAVRGIFTIGEGKRKINIMFRDKVSVTKGGGCKHVESPSIKIINSGKLTKNGPIDIILPPFKPSDEAPKYKHQPAQKIPGTVDKAWVDTNHKEFGNMNPNKYPEGLKFALQFANDYNKELKLLYNSPNNEENQYKLIEQIIKKCDYLSGFGIYSNTEKDEYLHNKYSDKE